MTPLRKKLTIAGAILLALLLVAASTLAYLWNQATALPEWYTEGEVSEFAGPPEDMSDVPPGSSQWLAFDAEGNRIPEAEAALQMGLGAWPSEAGAEAAPGSPEAAPRRYYDYAEPAASPTPRVRPPRTGPKPERYEMRGFHRHVRKPSPAVRASRAVYADGTLEIGIILDLQQLPVDRLKPRDRARYERAVANFPGILERDIWVGVQDEPLRVGGYLALSPAAEVRVGKLTYSVDGAATRLGMTAMELRLEVNRELRRLGFVDPDA